MKPKDDALRIYRDNGVYRKYALLSGAAALMFFCFFYIAKDDDHPVSLVFEKGLALFMMGFFGIAAISFATKWLQLKPVLEINKLGFVNRTPGGHGRLVPWSEVKKIRVFDSHTLVFIQNPEAYLSATRFFLFQRIQRQNLKELGTPIIIAHKFMPVAPMEIERELGAAWDQWKKATGVDAPPFPPPKLLDLL